MHVDVFHKGLSESFSELTVAGWIDSPPISLNPGSGGWPMLQSYCLKLRLEPGGYLQSAYGLSCVKVCVSIRATLSHG